MFRLAIARADRSTRHLAEAALHGEEDNDDRREQSWAREAGRRRQIAACQEEHHLEPRREEQRLSSSMKRLAGKYIPGSFLHSSGTCLRERSGIHCSESCAFDSICKRWRCVAAALPAPFGDQPPDQNPEGMTQAERRDNHEGSRLEVGPADGSSSRTDSRYIGGGVYRHSSCCDALAGTPANGVRIRAGEEGDSRAGGHLVQAEESHFRHWVRHTVDLGDNHGLLEAVRSSLLREDPEWKAG